jgi:GNAT superfamily N-acetyltransferase
MTHALHRASRLWPDPDDEHLGCTSAEQAAPAAPACQPAADAGPCVVLADDTCTSVLSQVIADACHDLAPSRWLIPDPDARRRIFPGYYRLLVEHALAEGIVLTTPGQDAAAVWLPVSQEAAPPPGRDSGRLAAVTGPWTGRFEVFGQELGRRQPAGFAYHYLAVLAVRPDRQAQGLGSALLRAHHAVLDRDGIPACLHAADLRSRRLYLGHGYQDRGLIFLPGAVMHPLLRPTSGQPERARR